MKSELERKDTVMFEPQGRTALMPELEGRPLFSSKATTHQIEYNPASSQGQLEDHAISSL